MMTFRLTKTRFLIAVVLIWVTLSATWCLRVETCYQYDGLGELKPSPVFNSGPINASVVRITNVNNTSSDFRAEQVIYDALVRNGFESIEFDMTSFYSELPFMDIKKDDLYKQSPTLNHGGYVIRYWLSERVSNVCDQYDLLLGRKDGYHVLETKGLLSRNQPELLMGRCIASEVSLPKAPYQIIFDQESRVNSQPFWVLSFPHLIAGRTRNWNRIRIIDTRTNQLLARHYQIVFDAPTVHGGPVRGCFNNKAKLGILASTIMSHSGKPLVLLNPSSVERYRLATGATRE